MTTYQCCEHCWLARRNRSVYLSGSQKITHEHPWPCHHCPEGDQGKQRVEDTKA